MAFLWTAEEYVPKTIEIGELGFRTHSQSSLTSIDREESYSLPKHIRRIYVVNYTGSQAWSR